MRFEIELEDKKIILEKKNLALQADGEILVKLGDTAILVTTTIGRETEGDFLPLIVEYEERFYAAGKIFGSRFVRREGRPTEAAILTARFIDRAIRPLFPEDFAKEVQVIVTVLAWDGKNDPDIPALIGVMATLLLGNIPVRGCLGAVRVAKVGERIILNPEYDQRQMADFQLAVSGVKDKDGQILVNMLDGEGEIEEESALELIEKTKGAISKIIDSLLKNIKNKNIKNNLNFSDKKNTSEGFNIQEFDKEFDSNFQNKFLEILFSGRESKDGGEKISELSQEFQLSFSEDKRIFALKYFNKRVKNIFKKKILEEGIRVDGREFNEIRKLDMDVGYLPKTHGSGFFSRGLTKVLSILTLGAPGDELLLEGMEVVGKKRFLHHYNFPPYSVGEVKPLRGPGRREIGHGALVEKALKPVIPLCETFPYTIRVVSEIVSSNGSTSMASVCSSSLALFDGGVPIRQAVAGISVGLISEENEGPISKRNFKILTDIQGPEDHFGDMDLKIAGTREKITALQLDTKIIGLSVEMLSQGFRAARSARMKILDEMEKLIASPREKLSSFAPKISLLKINPEKIGDVIGSKGKTINEIIDQTGVSIDIEEDGSVFITAENDEAVKKAAEWIKNITKEAKIGEIFSGKVKKILDFGMFIEIFPGQDALLHVSKIPPSRKPLYKHFNVGDLLSVKVINIDNEGKISLDMLDEKNVLNKKI